MASPPQIGLSVPTDEARQLGLMRFFAFAVGAGLLICLLAAFTFLHLPAAHAPSLIALSIRALLFVVIAALAGTAGVWYYWRYSTSPYSVHSPIPFKFFVLCCAVGWVWVPAVVLLGREDSPLTASVAILGAAILAFALRTAIPSAAAAPQPPETHLPETDLFAATLRTPPRKALGYVLSLCIYGAACELVNGWILHASALLAVTAYTFVWSLTLAPVESSPTRSKQQSTRAVRRLGFVLIPAFLVTLFALLYGVGHRNRLEAAAAGAQHAGEDDEAHAATQPAASSLSSYHSVILWPIPEKKQILPPLPQQTNFLAPGTTKPLIIRFDGPYWYFQPPAKQPGATAIQAHGTPLLHDLQANNFIPLIMQAHQSLSVPIPISRCREIQLGILNNDNRPGPINVALLLTDSTQPNNQVLLGQQFVVSSQPGHFAIKSAPAAEVLRYEVPNPAKIRKFDHITVMFFPDSANYDVGPKVAIQQFQLIPR
jgi:hypothetical protein